MWHHIYISKQIATKLASLLQLNSQLLMFIHEIILDVSLFRTYWFLSQNSIDGDLCEMYNAMDPVKQKAIAEELDRTPNEVRQTDRYNCLLIYLYIDNLFNLL